MTSAKLGDVLDKIIDCEHKTAPETIGEVYAYSVGTPHLKEGRILYSQAKPISQETYLQWTKRGEPEAGDLILAREAPVGQVGLVGNIRVALGQRTVLLKVNKKLCVPRYLHYQLISPRMQRLMQVWSEGSTVAHLNVKDIPKLDIGILPPLSEQRRVAEILGSLDDKIEANNALLNSLDEYLRLDYVASINQDKDLRTVSDIAVEVREGVSAQEIDESDVYVGLEHLPRRNVWLSSWGNGSEVTSNKSRFKKGDILFGKLRPYFHKVVVAPVDGVCSTDIIVVHPKPGFEQLALQVLSSDAVIEYATNVSNGTRMPRAKWSDLKDFEVRGYAELKSVVSFDLAATLIAENRQLVETRDLLIRQLIG